MEGRRHFCKDVRFPLWGIIKLKREKDLIKDLQGIFIECISKMKSVHIPVQVERVIKIEPASLGCMGLCEAAYKNGGYVYTIKIKKELLNESVEGMELKEVIIHELLHTVPRCLGYGKKWRSLARKMNDAYGYSLLEEKDEDAIFPRGCQCFIK